MDHSVNERDDIVRFLMEDAEEYQDGGPFGKVVYACMAAAAEKIANGEHLIGRDSDGRQ